MILLTGLIFLPVFGEGVFRDKGCMDCHRFKGKGGSMGPDLTAVRDRRSVFWIRSQIKNPQKNSPNSRMPAFEDISELEIIALIAYLK